MGKYEAAYLHKFCVRRSHAHMNMTNEVLKCIKQECKKYGARCIRLDTGDDEKVVKQIYLDAGFNIVKVIKFDNGRALALYELRF